MAIYKVLRYPDERLRTECVPVTEFDDEFRKTADDMFETMYKNEGVGLAAPQVNIHRRFVVIDCSEDRSAQLVLANPVIVSKTGTASIDEGCLSIPEFRAKVKRNLRWMLTDFSPSASSTSLITLRESSSSTTCRSSRKTAR